MLVGIVVEYRLMLKGKSLTDAVIALALFGALVYVAYLLLPLPWFVVAAVAALYEAYALANSEPEDTISETIWRFSDRYPLVPLVGGGALGIGVWTGYISDPRVAVILGFLAGHFWFTSYRSNGRSN